jgi:hypothetical protein
MTLEVTREAEGLIKNLQGWNLEKSRELGLFGGLIAGH